jgi:phosphate transport system permease protein
MAELDQQQKVEQMRQLIAKRKRFDRLFSLTGVTLIVLSLGVLGALGVKLLLDGGGRLMETFSVTPWGMAPSSRDVVGTLEAVPASDGQPAGFALLPDPMLLKTVYATLDPRPLVGQRVAVKGTISKDGSISVDEMRAIPARAPGEEISGNPTVIGQIKDVRVDPRDPLLSNATLVPETMRIVPPEKIEYPLESLVGERVAVDPGRRGRKAELGLIEARDVVPLKTQTFVTGMLSTNPAETGMWPAIVGTVLVVIVTALMTIPLGVAAGVYLEEYAPKNTLTNIIEINIANLAGVPSVIWGLLGLGLFVSASAFGFGESVLTAGLTLGLLVLPIIIIATREAIRAIPNTIREASIGLGATKWQTIRYHVLPYSTGGILTGAIIAMSRAVGETAPLVLVGAAISINFTPLNDPANATALTWNPINWFNSQFTVIPMMTYYWVGLPDKEWHRVAAAGSIVLVAFTLSMNGIAIYLRYRLRRNIKW